jgi:hypothetical protein
MAATNRKMQSWALWVVLFSLLFLPAHAFDNDDVLSESAPHVKFDFAQHCQVGKRTFTLEKGTLQEVIDFLGKGRIENTSPSGDADPLWDVAYRNGTWVVRFESGNDMGGAEHALTGVTVKSMAKYPGAAKLPAIDLPILFDFGSIGMSQADLERRLGRADIRQGMAEYQYIGSAIAKDYTGQVMKGDVTGALRVQVSAGKIVGIEMSHITSY